MYRRHKEAHLLQRSGTGYLKKDKRSNYIFPKYDERLVGVSGGYARLPSRTVFPL